MSDEIINAHFQELIQRLKLTKTQRETSTKRYNAISERLHKAYYDTEYDGNTKLLIGSFGKNTALRPLNDVDIIFKIPENIFAKFQSHQGNGPADLLQDVKNKLQSSYPLTDKRGWVKVVALEFENMPRIEILPAYERPDGIFIIPNSSDGGKWEKYDARAELHNITSASTQVRQLIKIIKHWRNGTSADISSYTIEQKVLTFADSNKITDDWLYTIGKFFSWLATDDDSAISTPAKTAHKRIEKAIQYADSGNCQDACTELRKVFEMFPSYNKNYSGIAKLSKLYPSSKEQYIEDELEVDLKSSINLSIKATAHTTLAGWNPGYYRLQDLIRKFGKIPPHFTINFAPITDYNGTVTYKWKVRNFGEEAKAQNDLRGEIADSNVGSGGITESTRYPHQHHYVECYMIENGICIARKLLFVPIGDTHE